MSRIKLIGYLKLVSLDLHFTTLYTLYLIEFTDHSYYWNSLLALELQCQIAKSFKVIINCVINYNLNLH